MARNTRTFIQAFLRGQNPQKNYQQAYDLAMDAAAKVSADALERLGVLRNSAGFLVVPVLSGNFHVDLASRTVKDDQGLKAPAPWAILVLHYLLGRPRQIHSPEFISFMDIPEARGYAKPYQGRVVSRFLHTAGRDADTFAAAAERLAARKFQAGDAAYEFHIFPQARVRIIWFRGDDELSPGASFLYAPEIADLFCVEDIVVMSELLVKVLSAKKSSS